MPRELTVSVIKADVGGFVGHSAMHPDLVHEATERLAVAKLHGPIIDFHVTACGDDLGLILTHEQGGNGIDVEEVIPPDLMLS